MHDNKVFIGGSLKRVPEANQPALMCRSKDKLRGKASWASRFLLEEVEKSGTLAARACHKGIPLTPSQTAWLSTATTALKRSPKVPAVLRGWIPLPLLQAQHPLQRYVPPYFAVSRKVADDLDLFALDPAVPHRVMRNLTTNHSSVPHSPARNETSS